jgi:hypothetical protein
MRYQSAREMQSDLELFAHRSGIALSDLAFERWVEANLHQGRREQEQVLARVRKLAVGAVGTPARSPLKTTLPGVMPATQQPISQPTLAAAQRSLQPAPLVPIAPRALASSAPPPGMSSAPPPSPLTTTGMEGARSVRASTASIPPPEFRDRRWRGPVLLAALVLGLLLVMAATPAAANLQSPFVRGVHSQVSAWLVQPIKRLWHSLTGHAEREPSQVELKSSTPGVRLVVDGKVVMNGAVMTELALGSQHRLQASAFGFAPLELSFTVQAGKQIVTVPPLTPMP